jgi:NADPH:quinone reductase-like Zn-dependent oxidoreductase
MKAAVYTRHGPPDVVVHITDVEKPAPKDNEILIRVRAAGINPLDWRLMQGGPYIVRMLLGLGKPKIKRPGVDVSGQVETVGRNVVHFKPGNAVFGMCKGTFAEYVCASESAFVIKPGNIAFEQAASVPVAALTALQGLRDKGKIQPGQKVLINGAAGGVGTFAVQIAKSFGAEVTAVCSTRNVDMVRSIGTDHVIDYTQEDFAKANQRYDIIFDNVGNHSLSACRSVLSPRGIDLMVGDQTGRGITSLLAHLIAALVWSCLLNQKFVFFIARLNKPDLTILHDLMATGKVTPVIDRCYKLSAAAEAIRYLTEKHALGKVVITFELPMLQGIIRKFEEVGLVYVRGHRIRDSRRNARCRERPLRLY